jgi:hypothetical protein
MNDSLRPREESTAGTADETGAPAKQASPEAAPTEHTPIQRQISEIPILTYRAPLGARVQFVTGIPLLFSWMWEGTGIPWPWSPVGISAPAVLARAALLTCGILLILTARSAPRTRILVLALSTMAGLWFTSGTLWAPVPDWLGGGRWCNDVPIWCHLLTPAFGVLVGGALGAGDAVWSRLRLFGLAGAAVVILAFYLWPVRGEPMYELLTGVCREWLQDSAIPGWSLVVLFASGFVLAVASALAALQRRTSRRAHVILTRILFVFVVALLVSRVAMVGEAMGGTLLQSFLLPLQALALLCRELALASALALLVAVWFEQHERRRQEGWAAAF